MNYFNLYSSYPDPTINAAWDSQIKEADKTPWLADTLAECESDLFARFVACYAELRALPRGARRALQRRLARSSELTTILPEYLQEGGRRLQHRMAWSLAGAALLLALGQGVVMAATITVTTDNPNIIENGQCSLIEAIVNANNDAATHADCAAGSGADTIILPENANLTLSNPNATLFTHRIGLPLITSPITIQGNGATIAREGNASAFRLMAVTNSGDLTLQQVTLSGGRAVNGGGGLVNYDGALTIENSTISSNTAYYGGGVRNFGTLTIENSTIAGNTAVTGGGVSNYGTLTIENSTIAGNTADNGGGIFNSGGPGNGILVIRNSTISGNTADVGGGLGNSSVCYFGCTSATLSIENSTISGNRANQGGGVFNNTRCYALDCSPAVATLNLNNSVIAGNQAAVSPEIANTSVVTANNFNLFGATGNAGVTGFTPGPTDIVPNVSLAQILGPLQNNGGRTLTHALVAGSPAIDAGNPSGCRDSRGLLLLADQRGFLRSDDGNFDGTARCDIGAYELTNILAVSDSTFVRQQYLDFLDRDPEAAGLAAWVNALDDGLPRASLIEAFMDSEEFFSKGKFIAQTYLGLLTRDAEYSGFRAWLEVLLAGVSHEQIVQWFLDSDEFTIRFGSSLTNSQFIERMYNNVLLRSADPGELNLWVGQLTSGQLTRAQVALGFLDSDEFQKINASQNEIDVSLLYFSMLRRDPDPGGFAGWVGVLNSGVPLNSVIDVFLNSPEYQAGF